MTEIENVSIGGYAFALEKDAATEAQNYISSLEEHYLSREGGREIMEGIEERMAELLLEKCGKGVVTRAHILSVIDVLGRPEKIEEDDEEASAPGEKPRRKLYRDMQDKKIAGVCSGLAAYFGADVAVFRLVFTLLALVVFFGGVEHGVWSLIVPAIYCILWIAMPPANTARERWAMKGETGSADEISRRFQAAGKEMGEAVENVVKSDAVGKVGRVFLVAIGIVTLLIGTAGLAAIGILGFKGTAFFGAPIASMLEELSTDAPAFMNMLGTPWIVVLALAAVIIPFVGMIYGGIMLIFDFKSPSWKPGLILFVLWLMILVVLLVLAVMGGFSTWLDAM